MAKNTCSVDGCEKDVRARAMCSLHYGRWRRANPDALRPRARHKPKSERICEIPNCGKPSEARGMCPNHYARWLRTGTPVRTCETCAIPVGDNRRFCSDACKPRCSVEGCDGHVRKRDYCASHYTQWEKAGEAKPFMFKWAEPGGKCVVCGDAVRPGSGRRKHCSSGCQVADSRHKSQRPASIVCALCGRSVSLRQRDKSGRLMRTDTIWCWECGRQSPEAIRFKRYGILPADYIAALAIGCPICRRKVEKLDVDHDHDCCPPRTHRLCGGCTRGLICGDCNRALGLFKDSTESLLAAIEYLEQVRGVKPPTS